MATDQDYYRAIRSTSLDTDDVVEANRGIGRRNPLRNTNRQQGLVDRDGEGDLRPNMGFTRADGTERAADITTYERGGEQWVRGVNARRPGGSFYVGRNEGISLSHAAGGFGYGGWAYFLLPEGTDMPASLDIRHSPSRRNRDHYSLRCLNSMRLDAYHGALDTLARNALARAVELERDPLKFSA